MAGYFIANFTIRDPEKFEQYCGVFESRRQSNPKDLKPRFSQLTQTVSLSHRL